MVAVKIKLPFRVKVPVLALGAQTKNRVCFARGGFAYLSPAHPDLSLPRDFLDFANAADYFLKKRPRAVAYDLHPDYHSTRFALSLNTPRRLLPVQHHHAHVCGCMVDNGLDNQRVIGVAFDGTGMGDDANLWGGEFFLCDYSGYRRKAHLRYIPMPGGEKAIWQPWRIACAWLYLIYKERMFGLGLDLMKRIDRDKWRVIKKMYQSGFNSPLTSSVGRLFDAVASLVLNKPKVGFEAEAAMDLEKNAGRIIPDEPCRPYRFKIRRQQEKYIIDPLPMFADIVWELRNGRPKQAIALKFHHSVARIIRNTCLLLREESGVNKVVLAGGVFQNKVLLNLASDLLYREDFKLFSPRQLSRNDSGICLGQAAIAQFKGRN